MNTTEPSGTDVAADAGSPPPPPEKRGVLDIPSKVIRRIAGHSVLLHANCTDEPDIEIIDSSPDQLDLQASLTIPYPEEALGSMLNRLRQDVASDLAYQTGRRVRRLDLRVDSFVASPPAPRVI